jgi:hypothetical protein
VDRQHSVEHALNVPFSHDERHLSCKSDASYSME